MNTPLAALCLAVLNLTAGLALASQPTPQTAPPEPKPVSPAIASTPVPRPALPGESFLFGFEPGSGPDAAAALGAWTPAAIGPGLPARWVVQTVDGSAGSGGSGGAATRALVAFPGANAKGMALAICRQVSVRDVALSVAVRPLEAACLGLGVAWRIAPTATTAPRGGPVTDAYAARWNPADDAFEVLLIRAGVERVLAAGKAPPPARPGTWRTISVAHVGSRIEATIDGSARLTVDDASLPGEGACGLLIKGSASAAFDDASIADVTPEPTTPRAVIAREARMVAPLVASDLARDFLRAAEALPPIEGSRTIFLDRAAGKAYTGRDADALTPEQREAMRELTLDERFYYLTRYGTPVAYARALDLAAAHGLARADGARILDFGFGGIGHLRMLAALGASAAGVDVDPVLQALYSAPGDTGEVPRWVPPATMAPAGPPGRVAVLTGRWPADGPVREAAGDGLDLFLSKNTLKNGYIHPAEPVDQRMLVNLGVPDEAFVAAVFGALKPGGVFLIYNLCPAPSVPPEPYKPWADGRSPFPRAMLEAAGFTVAAFDVVDDEPARAMGRALSWDRGDKPMDLAQDLFAWYTIAVKPAK